MKRYFDTYTKTNSPDDMTFLTSGYSHLDDNEVAIYIALVSRDHDSGEVFASIHRLHSSEVIRVIDGDCAESIEHAMELVEIAMAVHLYA